MQLGTRVSIASIRLVLCAVLMAGGLSGKLRAQEASAGASVSAAADAEVPPPVVTQAAPAPADATAPAAAPNAAERDPNERPWALLHRAYNTWDGSTGGLYAEDPGMGMPGAVRLQLGLGLYSGEDFFYEGDQVEQTSQSFTLSVTALEFLELFAGLQNRGTTTTIPTDPPRTSALHAFADVGFGAKLGWSVSPVVRLGGGVRFALRSDVGPEEAMLDSTSVGLKLDAAFDLQRMRSPWPLIIRLNVDYFFDNSASVIEDIEDQRYESLPSPMVKDNEVAHLVTRVERYGLNVNRVDVLTPLLGLELPLELTEDFSLHPLIEYRIGMPIARGGYDCPFFSGEDDRGENEPGADDTCLDDVGVEAWPMTLALGARLVPPVRGVSFLLGVDIGLTGTSTFVRELAPTSPFKAMLAFSYDYDARPVEPVVVTVAPPAPVVAPAPPVGRVHGTIVDARTQAALQGVVVAIARSEFTPVATNIAGRFSTYELPPGEVTLELTHPEYHPGTCSGVIPEAGGEVNVACSMNELPTAGSLTASVNDAFGGPLAGARVLVSGASSATGATDADGEARIADLPAGEYQARVEAEGYLTRGARFTVQKRTTSALQLALVARPAKASIAVKGTSVTAKALKFAPGTTVLAPGGSIVLAELADHLLRNPGSGRLRVQCDGDEGLALTRALVIKQGLLDLGVLESQVDAVAEPAKATTLTLVP